MILILISDQMVRNILIEVLICIKIYKIAEEYHNVWEDELRKVSSKEMNSLHYESTLFVYSCI